MLRVAESQTNLFIVFFVSVGLIAVVVLAIIIGIHAFLDGAGHYGPWEQIWAG
jgi:hypothetical protein